tara:strand:- start:319 stop:606 length:288 start_codon:yes stop_codon:yes gene_type:complete
MIEAADFHLKFSTKALMRRAHPIAVMKQARTTKIVRKTFRALKRSGQLPCSIPCHKYSNLPVSWAADSRLNPNHANAAVAEVQSDRKIRGLIRAR